MTNNRKPLSEAATVDRVKHIGYGEVVSLFRGHLDNFYAEFKRPEDADKAVAAVNEFDNVTELLEAVDEFMRGRMDDHLANCGKLRWSDNLFFPQIDREAICTCGYDRLVAAQEKFDE